MPEKMKFVSAFEAEQDDKSSVKYNSDGTLSVDVIRTGTWSHYWYGVVNITEEDLDKMITNFNDGVIGYVLTFNYHHLREQNFGKVAKLHTEVRSGKFSGQSMSVLIADIHLTDSAKKDVESGEIHNISAEMNSDYVGREVLPIPLLDKDGKPVLDEEGNEQTTYIKKSFGATLMGGAVTNYPFITELNKDGLGGNRNVNGRDDQQYSDHLGMRSSGNQQTMMFSCVDESCTTSEQKEWLKEHNFKYIIFEPSSDKSEIPDNKSEITNELTIDSCQFANALKDIDTPVLIGNRIYSSSEYLDCESDKRETAFAVVKTVTTDDGTIYEICRLHVNTDDQNIQHHSVERDSSVPKDEQKKPGQVPVEPVVPVQTFSMDDVKEMINRQNEAMESKFQTKLDEQKTVSEQALKELSDKNITLMANMNTSMEKEYRLGMKSFVASSAFSDASPAFKTVLDRALHGNRGITVKYYDPEKNEYSDLSLADLFVKIAETIDFKEDIPVQGKDKDGIKELSDPGSGDPSIVNVDEIDLTKDEFTKDEIAALSKDDKKFNELLRSVSPRRMPHGYRFSKPAADSAN